MAKFYILLAALPWAGAAVSQTCIGEECEAIAHESVAFLQTSSVRLAQGNSPKHIWPHPKGRLGSLSQTPYGLPSDVLEDLDSHLAWKWVSPQNLSEFVWGSLIDKDSNIIICASSGVFKHTPDGKQLWNQTGILHSQMPTLMGDRLYGMQMMSANMYSLDLQTGNVIWKKKIAGTTGKEGDMVEAHNGVVVAGVDEAPWTNPLVGIPSKRAIGVNASNGEQLWSYTPECGLWNVMALFPDEDTTIVMDYCGGLYRLNLYDGSLVWKTPGSFLSMTDGGSTLDPDGNVYTCSNGPLTMATMDQKGTHPGRLRKYNVTNGALIWQAKMSEACMNFPAVSPDGKTVVISSGTNVIDPPTLWLKEKGNTSEEIDSFYALQQELLANKTQRTFYGHDNAEGSILGFDTNSGKLMWEYAAEPWYGMSFALDEERAYLKVKGKSPLNFCGPPHWSGPIIDQNGKVYVARSDGLLHIYDPGDGSNTTFRTGDGALMSGTTFANGLMVVPTCSWVYVFRY